MGINKAYYWSEAEQKTIRNESEDVADSTEPIFKLDYLIKLEQLDQMILNEIGRAHV